PACHSFSLDPSAGAYDHLAAGQVQTVSGQYGVTDGMPSTPLFRSWTVTGTNDAPQVSAALTAAASEGGAASVVDALAGATDPDDNTTLSVIGLPAALPPGVSYDAPTHSFSLDPSSAAFDHLAAGQV